MPVADEKVALKVAVESMFAKQAVTNPDPETLGTEQPILISKIYEYTTLEEAAASIAQRHTTHAPPQGSHVKPRIIVVSYATQRADHKPVFYVKKGRQNVNGSVQIGRTWNLATLTGVNVPDPLGSLLIVGFKKPYFWEFASQQDRQDFENVTKDAFQRVRSQRKLQEQHRQLQEQQRQQQSMQQQQLQQQHLLVQQQQLEQRAAQERAAAQERVAQERAAQERAAQERSAQERAAQEKIMEEKAAQDRVLRERAFQEEAQRREIEREKQERALREQERALREQETALRDAESKEKEVRTELLRDELNEEQIREDRAESPPPPVPAVSRKRTVSRSRHIAPENDELNQTFISPQAGSPQTGVPVPPPHRASSSATPLEPVAPLRSKRSNPHIPSRAPTRSYRQPVQPEDANKLSNLHGVGTQHATETQRATGTHATGTQYGSGTQQMNEDTHLEPSPSFDKQPLEEAAANIEQQPTAAPPATSSFRDRTQHRTENFDFSPAARLSPLRSPQRSNRFSGSPQTRGDISPTTGTSFFPSEVHDLYSVIQETKSANLSELEAKIKKRLENLSDQIFSSVVDVDVQLGVVDKLVEGAIAECDATDAKLQGIALDLVGKTDDKRIKEIAQSTMANGGNGRSHDMTLSGSAGGSGGNTAEVTTLKYRQLAADIEKLLQVSRLDDSFVSELSNFRFVEPKSSQAVGQLAHVENLLVDLTQVLEMFSHRDRKGQQSDESTMQAFLEPKRTAQDLAYKFGSQIQQFIEHYLSEILTADAAAHASSLPFERGLEATLLETLMSYSGCVLFLRENIPQLHKSLLTAYARRVRDLYQQEITKVARKWSGQLQHIASERQSSALTKSHHNQHQQTNTLPGSSSKYTSPDAGTLPPTRLSELHAHYARLCDDIARKVAAQQMFVEHFFSVGSESNRRLAKLISTSPVSKRNAQGQQIIMAVQQMSFPNIDTSKSSSWNIMSIMQREIFPSLSETITRTALTGVTEFSMLESTFLITLLDVRAQEIRQTNQHFLTTVLDKVGKQLADEFETYVGLQARSILSSNFVTKKRVGVHYRVVQFTKNVLIAENGFCEALKLRRGNYAATETRKLLDRSYANVYRALSQGLNMDTYSASAGTGSSGNNSTTTGGNVNGFGLGNMSNLAGSVPGVGGIDETKEKLNRHVVMIENTYQLFNDMRPAVDSEFASPGIRRIVDDSHACYQRELEAYISDVLARPFGKVLAFLSQYDVSKGKKAIGSNGSKHKEAVSALKRAVKGVDAKEVKSGIEQLHKRVEKHFQDADRAVLDRVWEAIKAEYLSVYTRLTHTAQSLDGMNYIDFSRNDILSAF